MSKHTPGPWNKRAIYLLLHFSRKNDGPWDHEEIWPDDDSMNMPDETDAQLIAAAPELLDALEELHRLIDDAHDGERIYTYEVQKKVKAIIAKAKGES